jgi:hypothetical protein
VLRALLEMQNKTKRGPRGARRGGRVQGLGGGSHGIQPPPFTPTVSYRHKFRFTNGANNGAFAITRANMLNLYLTTPTAITSARIIQAIRLVSVEVWTNPVALGAPPSNCSIEWTGENSPSTIVESTGMGVRPAHVFSNPPPSSSNRWWSITGMSESDVLFLLSLPANSVIDVVADVRQIENEGPTAGDVPAGATVGAIYGDYLDGLVSGKLSPVGLSPLP